MRKPVVNSMLKMMMAQYGISVQELSEKVKRRRTYVSYMLNKRLSERQYTKLKDGIESLIMEE